MLMPAAALVFVILGAISVDFGAAHLGQRELVSAAQGAANDAANFGIDSPRFYAGDNSGELLFNRERAVRAARESLAASDIRNAELVTINLVDADTLEVVLRSSVPTIFSKAIPGGPDDFDLTAVARAELAGP